MSRSKTEINPVRAERFKIIAQRENITQTQLANRDSPYCIYLSQQGISRIMQQKSPLTEATAQRIIKVFPKYRLSWLLGIDDYMTESDAFDGLVKKLDHEHDDNIVTARHLAKLRHIDFQLYSSGMVQDENGRFLDCFLVRKDGKQAYITYDDLTDLICDLAALTESRLTRLIEKSK